MCSRWWRYGGNNGGIHPNWSQGFSFLSRQIPLARLYDWWALIRFVCVSKPAEDCGVGVAALLKIGIGNRYLNSLNIYLYKKNTLERKKKFCCSDQRKMITLRRYSDLAPRLMVYVTLTVRPPPFNPTVLTKPIQLRLNFDLRPQIGYLSFNCSNTKK